MATEPTIPSHFDLMWPTLEALRQLGGSGRIDEISSTVAAMEGFTEEQLAVRRRPGDSMSRVDYRLAWARNALKNIGAIENSARGVWALTDHGRNLDQERMREEVRAWRAEYNRQYQARKSSRQAELAHDSLGGSEDDEDEAADPLSWQEQLLHRLMQMPPDAFERLAQRLLREAGFRNVVVLGKSGDGGIDGVGVYRVSLVSFPVYFQCKRYTNQVGASAVRDFRGAMAGRGEKGLLITTASFSPAARAEATRDGAPPVDLISGEELCQLLAEYRMGVTTRLEPVYEIDESYFDQF